VSGIQSKASGFQISQFSNSLLRSLGKLDSGMTILSGGVVYSKEETLMERVMGIEPTYAAWKATVLPLNYTRMA
jgi:hypothetical protein